MHTMGAMATRGGALARAGGVPWHFELPSKAKGLRLSPALGSPASLPPCGSGTL